MTDPVLQEIANLKKKIVELQARLDKAEKILRPLIKAAREENSLD